MDLFSPVQLGDLELANRVVMAPLTRTRSGDSGVPGDLVVEHYAQRAGLGLIVTEGTYPSHESRSYPGQPGIVTDEQASGWARVAEAVHARGGRIVMQVMNGGRVSHPAITGTDRIVAPSAIAVPGEVRTPQGKLPYPVPHALTTEEAVAVKAEFVAAARRAVDAGLDGVEVHGANGYLLHEFLGADSNTRTDVYGGSPESRARFVAEVVTEVAAEIGAGRVGLRISPQHGVQGVVEPDADDVAATYASLVDAIAPLGLAYLSVLHKEPAGELVQDLRRRFGGKFMINTGFAEPTERDEAISYVADELADVVAVGRAVIANPDLVERWVGGHPENAPDPSTFYGDGAKGYTDYPTLAQV
ncbi:2,4-dienoyl-CoA reductase [Klenkia marina]|uniref:2,4-dienoyl-CoA reductase n=1 Tax=Klenkia marina TaxID=1960309 RepID=A0A1G4Y5Q4_9ACTN|nr:alkene reductase [Klenkia marina]SCX48752.1 2,4-dienoyl-CoA reductase [Klenkia marina]